MAIPKKGDTVVRTGDDRRFVVDDVIEAGGEDMYTIRAEDGSEMVEVSGASFVREHDEDRAEFEVVG